jgi:tRNA threonylcarbamoyladenosine biosynthesis protein TsaB
VLLAFDTATPFVTVALHDGDGVVSELHSDQKMKHGEQLAPLIDRAMRERGLVRQDLTAIAVGVGPGPFTGLRVGLVTARTLGFVLEIPVYGVCSLDVLALEAVETGAVTGDFVVATDARRKEVYWARYADSRTRLTDPAVDRPADIADRVAGLPAVGAGALLYPDTFPRAHEPEHVSAAALAALAAERLTAGEELPAPRPLYLRRPDAQVPKNYKVVTPK